MLKSGEGSSRRKIRAAILPAMVTVSLVIPNLVVIALGIENFPFTTAPMFAHYVGPDTRLYAFRFEGVRDGEVEPLPLEETNRHPIEVMRQFVSWYYRPMTDTSPLRDLGSQPATPEQFAARMGEFFQPITEFLRDRRGIEYDTVEVYVDIVDSAGERVTTHHVGQYETSTGRYTITYEVAE